MKLIALFVALASCGVGWAKGTVLEDGTVIPCTLHDSTPTSRVSVGTNVWLLSDFVSSGEFCKWRGKHEWVERVPFNDEGWRVTINPDPCEQKCGLCGKCRQKIKKQTIREEWED